MGLKRRCDWLPLFDTGKSQRSGRRQHQTSFAVRASRRVGSKRADEVCYWRDMTVVPHLLNLLFKREIGANYSFSSGKVRAGNLKEIAYERRDEIVSMR